MGSPLQDTGGFTNATECRVARYARMIQCKTEILDFLASVGVLSRSLSGMDYWPSPEAGKPTDVDGGLIKRASGCRGLCSAVD